MYSAIRRLTGFAIISLLDTEPETAILFPPFIMKGIKALHLLPWSDPMPASFAFRPGTI
jgi:hypothetical protein